MADIRFFLVGAWSVFYGIIVFRFASGYTWPSNDAGEGYLVLDGLVVAGLVHLWLQRWLADHQPPTKDGWVWWFDVLTTWFPTGMLLLAVFVTFNKVGLVPWWPKYIWNVRVIVLATLWADLQYTYKVYWKKGTPARTAAPAPAAGQGH